MRIVGGRLRGRPLLGPEAGSGIRPTSDRLRESIFNILAHALDDPVPGARALDLFAGTGALGLEALSRGAPLATFVDSNAKALRLIAQNVEHLGRTSSTTLLRRDATRLGPAEGAFDLAFCDPPYGHDLAGPALASCLAGGWLAPAALVVVEESASAGFKLPGSFAQLDRRRYGESEIVIGRLADG